MESHTWRVPYRKVVYGVVCVEAESKEQAYEQARCDEHIEDLENKSEYKFDRKRIERW
jgi:hypothetical protein